MGLEPRGRSRVDPLLQKAVILGAGRNWGAGLRMAFSSLVLWPMPSLAQECPSQLRTALRVVAVATTDMASSGARIKLLERDAPDQPWTTVAEDIPAVVGKNGLGWGGDFHGPGPAKAEGDGKSPAGIFQLGRSFGFGARSLPGYLRLDAEHYACVADPRSDRYGQITSDRLPPGTRAEDMSSIAGYRSGLVVDYPADGATRSGSCIFVHVWRDKQSGTAGCIALEEQGVMRLQRWVGRERSMIAILPRTSFPFLDRCLQGKAD